MCHGRTWKYEYILQCDGVFMLIGTYISLAVEDVTQAIRDKEQWEQEKAMSWQVRPTKCTVKTSRVWTPLDYRNLYYDEMLVSKHTQEPKDFITQNMVSSAGLKNHAGEQMKCSTFSDSYCNESVCVLFHLK